MQGSWAGNLDLLARPHGGHPGEGSPGPALTGGQDMPDKLLLGDAPILVSVNAAKDVQDPGLPVADPLQVPLAPDSKVEVGHFFQLCERQRETAPHPVSGGRRKGPARAPLHSGHPRKAHKQGERPMPSLSPHPHGWQREGGSWPRRGLAP